MFLRFHSVYSFFFFNDTATTEIYTLSLHDALPISVFLEHKTRGSERIIRVTEAVQILRHFAEARESYHRGVGEDRKSTRLNSSHSQISYAVFCLKKKSRTRQRYHTIPSASLMIEHY